MDFLRGDVRERARVRCSGEEERHTSSSQGGQKPGPVRAGSPSGGHGAVEPPGPIPNPEVKRRSADGSGTTGPVRVGRRQVYARSRVKSGPGSFFVRTKGRSNGGATSPSLKGWRRSHPARVVRWGGGGAKGGAGPWVRIAPVTRAALRETRGKCGGDLETRENLPEA